MRMAHMHAQKLTHTHLVIATQSVPVLNQPCETHSPSRTHASMTIKVQDQVDKYIEQLKLFILLND